jgi:hypothetical protein
MNAILGSYHGTVAGTNVIAWCTNMVFAIRRNLFSGPVQIQEFFCLRTGHFLKIEPENDAT